jgi:RNA polymerase sigma factor (sigma-70 family)
MTPAQLATALPIVRGLARKMARGDESWRQDLEQEGWLKLCGAIGYFDPSRGTWGQFVCTVAGNAMHKAHRARSVVRVAWNGEREAIRVLSLDVRCGDGDAVVDVFESTDPRADQVAESRERLRRLATELTPDELDLVLSGISTPTCAAVGRSVGLTPQTINLRKQAALAKAREVDNQ